MLSKGGATPSTEMDPNASPAVKHQIVSDSGLRRQHERSNIENQTQSDDGGTTHDAVKLGSDEGDT